MVSPSNGTVEVPLEYESRGADVMETFFRDQNVRRVEDRNRPGFIFSH